ncbi:VOC family protein [Ramlibacter sp. AN1015]|uniref:VOC family protein n=1 Tax=Ramlibacter sp. AN1015 TaxID=3133428 RepID=UPI0030BB9EB5
MHFELPYEDRERVMRFYQEAFGWKLQALGEAMGDYVLATTAEADAMPDAPAGAINGGLFPRKPDWPAQYPSVVIGTRDVKDSMQRVRAGGGQVLGEPMDIPGVGAYVSFMDTEGNRLSLLQPLGGNRA